ncbi:MAG: histidine kinase [Bacteroidetes bacterium]|jgi:PAS domain S-box-containing protein|nr:histidine kinase [Bacteroidota bacterium]MDF2451847.1 histidine kinase [Bacteroidota bacterium]
MEIDHTVKILMVDDRQENLFALEVILADRNYVFVKANSGKDALKILLQEQDFAIILMDVQMPIMDGLETAKIIRESDKFKHVPIIFLTANIDNPEDIFKGYETGAVDFMVKPLSPDILRAKVSVFVELYKKNHELTVQSEYMKSLNSQLEKQSRYVRSLIESSLDPMVTINLDGKITDMNEALEKITGLSRETIKDTDFVDYFTRPKIANEAYHDVFEKGYIADYLLAIKDKDGTVTEVLCNGSVYKDEHGKVTGAVIVVREKLLSKYSRSLIEASLDPLITISSEGKITDMNEALVDITGITREKIKGTDFFDYFTEPEKARRVYEEAFAKGFVVNSPLTIRHKDGKVTDVLFNGSTYKDERGNILGIVIVARDVTEQKRFEKELIEAKSKAEEAMRAKQQFLSNMSHEIRTPLNAIIGFTNVIVKTKLDEKQKEYVNAIKSSGDSLIVLINDILDLAKVDAGKMTFEETPFKLQDSITSMLKMFDTRITEKEIKLINEYDSSIPEVLVGDPVRLHQVLMNLVNNAIKFTSQGKVTVGAKLLNENEEKATIKFYIQDTGIGIPKDKIETIFDNFQQATTGTTRLFGGTGLGLSIVKQLVEAQGGKVFVESEDGKGSTFSFTLSFLKTNETIKTEDTNNIEPKSENKNVKILVAEDIKFNQLLMKTILEGFGFSMDIAENGKLAVEKMKSKPYDLILMDLQMPEMNGFEATEFIRKNINKEIPIIALTADVTTVDVKKCRAIGMNDYISKPVDDKLLYKMIMDYIKPGSDKNGVTENKDAANATEEKVKYVNLNYLKELTGGKQEGMVLMIKAYLEETPTLLKALKDNIGTKNWDAVGAAAHSIIPSFSMLGMDVKYEKMSRKIQELTTKKENLESVEGLVLEIEEACLQAMKELEEELVVLEEIH